MEIQHHSTFFLLFLSATLLTLTTADNTFPPTSKDTDFIRTSCRTTLYPRICYTSLSGYSSAVQQDPGRLARVAIGVTLSKANHLAKYVANISGKADYVMCMYFSRHIFTHKSGRTFFFTELVLFFRTIFTFFVSNRGFIC